MGHWLTGLAVLALTAGAAPAFAAGGGVRLEVTRALGSAVCPNAGGIVYTAAKLFPDTPLRLARADDDSAPRIEISVQPVEGGHSAVLRSAGGERTIVDWDLQCRGLGEALAVALVVLVAPPSASAAPEPVALEPEQPEPADVANAEERPWRLGVEAGGLGGVGLLGEPVFGAAQHAAASGLTASSGSASRRWLVAGPSFGLALALVGPLAFAAGAGMTVRLHDQSYFVDDQSVQHQPLVGGYALLGLEASWPVSTATRRR